MRKRSAALARRAVQKTLTEHCHIERETGAAGLMGEPLHEWEMVAAWVPCRVISAGRRNQSAYAEVGATEALVERYRLICPVGTGFAVDDRVVMTDGRIYQIVDVVDGWTDSAFSGALMVRERD